jgi:hypothetical protein
VILSAIWRGPKAAFQYPIQAAAPAAVPTAVMVPWFRPTRGAARFFEKLPAENARQAAIAATWTQFEQLMRARIPPPTHAAIVLWRAGESLLTTEQRDRLWAAFRVPVFEQIIGDRGELLAAECEAHAGLHIEWPSFRPSGLRLEPAACPCGRKTPRLTVRQDHAPAGSPPSHSRKAVSG